ncbi:hypothetical protein BLS_002840 [Venturia inaequalis]|uniref:Uncharacterized protein n=1 Tax=Venturia inaequalis TaxID=5025 RepID=A0A8H3U142_VENIN|nr:hypothetical protein BLS_002840 [Venturia inaequalis]
MDNAPTVESEARDADRYSEIIQQLMIIQQNQSALLEQQAAQLTDAANGLKKADTAYNTIKSDNDSLKAFMKAKWVSKAELDSRREKGLYFRYGASGHRSSEYVYRAAENPSRRSVAMSVLGAAYAKDVGPVLEDSGSSKPGKE